MKTQHISHQFPAGGWFGALIGSTAWVPLFTVSQITHFPKFAILNLIFCFVCIALGTMLWFRKDNFSRTVSTQLLIFISFLPSAATVISAVWLGVSDAKPSLLWMLLIYPYVAVFTFIMLRRRIKSAEQGAAPNAYPPLS